MRDDGDAFGDVLTQAAGVVVMGMRVHHVADWLVRDGLADKLVHDLQSRIARGSFKHHDMIGELDGEAAGAGAVQRPEAVADLLNRRHRHCGRGRRRRHVCGTGNETAALGCTSAIMMSSVGKPSCFSTMCRGNWMSPNCA